MGIKRVLNKSKALEVSLEDAFELFISEKKSLNKSDATISNYKITFSRWQKYLEVSERSLLCKDVDESYVYSFMNYLRDDDLSQTSVGHYIREVRSFLYWCMDKGFIEEHFEIKMPSVEEEIIETYDDEEVEALISRPRDKDGFTEWRSWAIVNWVIATGSRARTITEITMGDLNFTDKEIRIRKTKTRKAYIIPMSSALSTVLKEYIKRFRASSGDEKFLFPNIGDEQLTVNALKHSIIKYNKGRGVDRTSIHALRHTFAKRWVRGGGDVFRLQKLLGHTTLDMTRHYVNLFSADMKEGFDEVNPLDKIKKGTSRTKKIVRTDKD